MEIYALQGTSNSGKTSTINALFNLLTAKYPKASVSILQQGPGNDIKVIMTGVKGKIIGIESQGDPNSRLQQSLSDFQKAKCDIVFCACRTRGMTVQWINSYSSRHTIHFIQKNHSNKGHSAANSSAAAALIQQAGL